MLPRRVLLTCSAFAALRFAAFVAIYSTQSYDAQWQFEYLPLWISDLPISLVYIFARLPIPYAEGIIGPIWWFFLPFGVWWLWGRWKARRTPHEVS